jgi:hypothetical protein
MIGRVAIHERTPGSIASEEARGFRAWIKEQPGSSVATMRRTQRRVSQYPSQCGTPRIVCGRSGIWALRDRTTPGGPVGIKTDREELFDVVEEF